MENEMIENEIYDAIIKTSYEWYGIRHTHYPVDIGSDVPFSFDWDFENDTSSDEGLDGASCIDIQVTNKLWDFEKMDDDDAAEMIRVIRRAISDAACYGGQLMVVAGRHRGYGSDHNEILIDGIRIF